MTKPPWLAARLLEWWLPAGDGDEILGDLDEQFARRVNDATVAGARRWYWAQTLDLICRYEGRYRLPAAAQTRRSMMLSDDLRQVWIRLRSRPAAAAITVTMLAAAIGLSTGTFAVLDSLVLQRAPFEDADRLRTVAIQFRYGEDNPELINLMKGWREAGTFQAVEAAGVVPLADERSTTSTGTAALVTPGLFQMLGVSPVRGRTFTADDTRAGDLEPVLISEGLWRTAFGADATRLGQRISLHGSEYHLVGVMPADFRFPSWDTVLWRPLSFDAVPFPASATRDAYVRLPEGIPEADVIAQATRVAGTADPRFTARPNQLYAEHIGGVIDDYAGRAIPLFAGAVGLIFLALCANAASLQLAQMTVRRRELGVRLALGASRWRLLRESALEHLVTGAAGVAAGVGLATVVIAVAQRLLDEFNLTQSLNPINVDARALVIAAALGFIAVWVTGLLPAWSGTRLDPTVSIKPAELTHTQSRSARTMTRTLLVAQIAFASMLLIGAALLARSFDRMANADRWMDARGVYTMTAFMSSVSPGVLDDLEARIAAIPGIEDVTVAGAAPPEASFRLTAQWRTDVVDGVDIPMHLYEVRPDFFSFYGITLLKGRPFQAGDTADAAIVGERMAALLWPNEDPLGKTMSTDRRPFHLQVIGVAKEITLPSLSDGVELPEIYVPHSGRRSVLTVSWRCFTACPDRQQMAARIRDVDPQAETLHLTSTEQLYARQLVRPRAAAQLGATFAGIGFVTSGAGLFAVLSYIVGRRRREFGIRIALGATPAILRRSVSREALSVTAIGVAIGGLGTWLLGPALASVMYGVSTNDPLAWLAMAAIVTITTLGASWRPSRQAARVDPVQLLREE